MINIKGLRKKLGMSQRTFSKAYGIPIGTLFNWEQKRREPDTTTQSYLKAIGRLPRQIRRALANKKKK